MLKLVLSDVEENLEKSLLDNLITYENRQITKKEGLVIVPEQFLHDANVLLTSKLKTQVRFFSEVTSFSSINKRYKEEMGLMYPLLDEISMLILVKNTINEIKDELVYYKKIYNKISFVNSLNTTIIELIKSKTEPEQLTNIKDISQEQKNKYEDIAKVYKKFLDNCNETFVSSDNLTQIVGENVDKWRFLEDKQIHISYFNGFVETEFSFILSLVEKGFDVTIYLYVDRYITKENLEKGIKIKDFDPFFSTKKIPQKFYEKLKALEKLHLLEIENIFLNKAKESTYLDFVKNNYFGYKKISKDLNTENIEDKSVKIIKYKNKYEELQGVVSYINRKIEEENLHYSDFIIVCADPKAYEIPFNVVFSKTNFPYFLDSKNSILGHQLTDYLFSLINVVEHRYKYEDVFRVLKNDFCNLKNKDGKRFTYNDIELLENYVLKHRISDKKWFKPFIEEDDNKQAYYKHLNEIRVAFLEKIEPFMRQANKKNKVSATIVAIYEFLLKEEIDQRLNYILNNEDNKKVISETLQIWNKIIIVFEKMIETLGETEVYFYEFKDLLETAFNSMEFGYVPDINDTVKIIDVFRSRFDAVKNIIFIGAIEGVYPKFTESSSFFDDDDIDVFDKTSISLYNTSFVRLNIQSLNMYHAINKTSDNLLVTYPNSTITGESNKPSVFVGRLLNLIPISVEVKEDDFYNLSQLYNLCYNEDILFDEKEFVKENISKHYSSINKTAIEKIYALEFVESVINGYESFILDSDGYLNTSISKIEKYNSCPYSYFLHYDIKARKREEFEVANNDFGNVFHASLEQYFKNNNTLDAVNDIVEKVVEEHGEGILNETAQYRFYVDNIKSILYEAIKNFEIQINAGDYKVIKNEHDIEIDDKTNKGQKYKYKGYVDRIDAFQHDENNYLRVIDYKSSKKTIDFGKVTDGVNLQLLKYLKTIVEKDDTLGDNRKIGGALYLEVKNAFTNFDNKSKEKETENLSAYKFTGIINDDVVNVSAFDKKTKSTAIIGKNSTKETKKVPEDEFKKLLEFVDYKINNTIDKIISGDINTTPLFYDEKDTPCKYCDYSIICQVKNCDKKVNGNVTFSSKSSIDDEIDSFFNEIKSKE